ncbi:hypothetical protein ABKA04_006734 [Annulohypoxylon sp. FPYF3050]
MPTPESEAFLAKKPAVPPTFEGVDFEDNKRLKQAQDAIIREQWVGVMMGRLVREELSKCYYREGVNHLEKCGALREKYLQLLKNVRVKGYMFEQRNVSRSKVVTDGVEQIRAIEWTIGWTSAKSTPKLRPSHTKFLELQNLKIRTHQFNHTSQSYQHKSSTMICKRCLQRASALSSRIPLRASRAVRPFSTTLTQRSPPAAPSPSSTSKPSSEQPVLSTPLADTPAGEAKPSISACPEGTILTGLNYFKNKEDPIALSDDAYPSWLWTCIETEKKEEESAEDEGDEFSKSKKQRRLAAKRQRALEAKILAGGDLSALMPKVPLHHQSINLPGNEDNTVEGALAAQEARDELNKAMRKDRKKSIKEANYLKSM